MGFNRRPNRAFPCSSLSVTVSNRSGHCLLTLQVYFPFLFLIDLCLARALILADDDRVDDLALRLLKDLIPRLKLLENPIEHINYNLQYRQP